MKCLSLWQPWAALMMLNKKRNETRPWYTKYRGPLAIHAAKMWNAELEEICYQDEFKAALSCGNTVMFKNSLKQTLVFGAIVGIVDVKNCIRITAENAPAGVERLFGDYTPGRYAIVTENARRLREPIPYRGMQGMFEVPDDIFSGAQFLQDVENDELYQRVLAAYQGAKDNATISGPEFDRLTTMRLLINAWNKGKKNQKVLEQMSAILKQSYE
jgi:hypothetical protein